MQQRLQGPGWDGESGAAASPEVSRACRLLSDHQANSAGELTATAARERKDFFSYAGGMRVFAPAAGPSGSSEVEMRDVKRISSLPGGREMKGWRERRGLKCEIFKLEGRDAGTLPEIPSSPSVCTPSASL